MKHTQDLINQLKQELHTRLLWELLDEEFAALENGSSTAKSKYECFATVMEWKISTYTQILEYYGYEFDHFNFMVKHLYEMILLLENEGAVKNDN